MGRKEGNGESSYRNLIFGVRELKLEEDLQVPSYLINVLQGTASIGQAPISATGP